MEFLFDFSTLNELKNKMIRLFCKTGIFNPHMAPPTVTGMSVQFQPMMQQQIVDNSQQILEQQSQQNFQTHLQQHMNATMHQQINENQQKLNGMQFSVQNLPQPVPYPQQVCENHEKTQ